MQTNLSTPTFGDTRLPPRFWRKVRLGSTPVHRPDLGPCWEWTGARNNDGYGEFVGGSRTDGSNRLVRAHRLAYETLIGPIPDGLESDHLCRSRSCVNPGHLEPVTHRLNLRRSPVMGAPKGEAHGQAKLREADIRIIRALVGQASQRALAARFGVSPRQISDIQRGKYWTHV